MATILLPPDFKDFIRFLNSENVEYLLVGGYAVSFDECYANRITDVVDGVDVNLISLDNLKANKKAVGRPKDLDDLENLP